MLVVVEMSSNWAEELHWMELRLAGGKRGRGPGAALEGFPMVVREENAERNGNSLRNIIVRREWRSIRRIGGVVNGDL